MIRKGDRWRPSSAWLVIEQSSLVAALAIALRIWFAQLLGRSPGCPIGNACEIVLASQIASLQGVPISLLGALAAGALLGFVVGEWLGATTPGKLHLLLALLTTSVSIGLQVYASIEFGSLCSLCAMYCMTLVVSSMALIARRGFATVGNRFHALWLLASILLACGQFLISPPLARTGVVTKLFVANKMGMNQFIRGPHVRLGRQESERCLYVFADPECNHCATEIPGLFARLRRTQSEPQVILCWVTKTDIGRLRAAMACSLAMRNPEPQSISVVFGPSLATEKDIRNAGKRLGVPEHDLNEIWIDRSPIAVSLRADRDLAAKLGITSTPAFIATSTGQQFVELNSNEALAYIGE